MDNREEQILMEAQEKLLKKREELKATTNPIPLIMSFRDYIPKCIHGITMDEVFKCEECEKRREKDRKIFEESSELNKEMELKEAEKNKKYREEREKALREHPEDFMGFIPKKFRGRSLDNFKGAIEIKKIIREYSDGFIRDIRYIAGKSLLDEGLFQYPGSILLTGKTGCGKTHLAVSIITELTKRGAGVDCLFITAPELLLEIRSTFNNNKKYDSWDKEECKTEEEILDKYSRCELLILDDLGAEKTSDFTIQSLYLVIDRRNRELRPTIVTSNLSLEEIEEKIDARMASRLADMKVIKLNMPDYRKKRATKESNAVDEPKADISDIPF